MQSNNIANMAPISVTKHPSLILREWLLKFKIKGQHILNQDGREKIINASKNAVF